MNPLIDKKHKLYFIKSFYPTPAELEHATSISCTAFRNAGKDDGTQVEKCDGVAGLVPKQYYSAEAKALAPIIKGEDYDPDAEAAKATPKKDEKK